jgi:TetR/AcrR family transcriptional regulator
MSAPVRRRDAERSRRAILDAAEELFARQGYSATSMQEIAAAAGLARATPGYFFGSKEALYEAVLRRVHELRSRAIEEACAPLRSWAADGDAGHAELRAAVAVAVDGYIAFLRERPTFARLIEWESLSGAERLPPDLSTSFSAAFRAVHRVGAERGLRDFDVRLVVVALISLCFLPVAHASTFGAAGGGIDTTSPRFLARYREQIVDSVMALLLESN